MTQVDVRARLPRDLLWVGAAGLTAFSVFLVQTTRWGVDAHAYWDAWRGSMYGGPPTSVDAYLYSPAFAQAIWPLAQLPWWAFGVIWCSAAVASYLFLFRPLGWGWAVPLTLCCLPDALVGNTVWVFALVVAFGLRFPALWAYPALTKVTPALGPLWFLVRREWRALGISVGTTLVIAVVSFAASPHLWHEWLDFLRASAHQGGRATSFLIPPLLVRLPVALALLVWGALTDRRWALPAAVALATPVSTLANACVLAALPRLYAAQPPSVVGQKGR